MTQTAPTTDWRVSIPEIRRRPIRIWLWSIAAMTLAVLIVGGITRLTHSGLSMVQWEPLVGIVPPLNEAQWQETFDAYKQFPEYQKLRRGMTLAEFKFIFFWEYLHRVLARLIGLVFLVPFLYFAARGYFTRPVALRAIGLFVLGSMQGLMGWLMVASGLVDRPSVSHYRLAAHLVLAFLIFGSAIWLARQLRVTGSATIIDSATARLLRRGLTLIGVLLALQVIWGAFVAGLKAGFFLNTFPLMAGRFVPPGILMLEPALLNFVENAAAVQWTHRWLGTLLTAAMLVFWIRVRRSPADQASRRLATGLTVLLVAQYVIGIFTLINAVPVALGVIHQAAAMVIFGVWIIWLHHVRQLQPGSAVLGQPSAA